MTINKNAVRSILDQAKAAERAALTAPEARGVCEAYGIAIPTPRATLHGTYAEAIQDSLPRDRKNHP